MTNKSYWDVARSSSRGEFVQVGEREVVFGEQSSSPFCDSAGSCTLEEFLQGPARDYVRERFGAGVLAEVDEAVRSQIARNAKNESKTGE